MSSKDMGAQLAEDICPQLFVVAKPEFPVIIPPKMDYDPSAVLLKGNEHDWFVKEVKFFISKIKFDLFKNPLPPLPTHSFSLLNVCLVPILPLTNYYKNKHDKCSYVLLNNGLSSKI